jgi:hypothetical protein
MEIFRQTKQIYFKNWPPPSIAFGRQKKFFRVMGIQVGLLPNKILGELWAFG